ncbi:putative exported phage protein [Burkholderia aenigmatica]|uniref:glycosyl hydrolase family 28-related protein n=1 Tax=Burkholderia cepacia complex TaxID=87882 RepID=UPI000F097720|nr:MULTISPECIES: glycosyl hydrolase family 28-related protein [Burkholderia cepacia complex]AYQ38541.1 pectate lyase [Burkholderia lata]VWC47528.1 putative exported phage protein [Burkholderia aenigmatica]
MSGRISIFPWAKLNAVVDSVAALRALPKTIYNNAFTTGYYAANDGAAGAFRLDPTDTTSADNGGTIIVAADGGRWKKLIVGKMVCASEFGVVMDGRDNTAASKAAIAAASASTEFKTIYFGPGTTQVSDTLTIQSEGVRLIGAGGGGVHDNAPVINALTRFIWTGASGGTCVKIQPDPATSNQWVADNGVEGIFFDGNNALGGIAVNLVACRYGDYDIRAGHWKTTFVQMDVNPTTAENGDCSGNRFRTIAGYQSNAADGSFLICNSNASYNCCWNQYELIEGNWLASPMVILNGNDNEKFFTVNGYNPTSNVAVYGIVCNGGPAFLQTTRHLTFYHVSTTANGGGGVFAQGTDHATDAAYAINILYYDIDNNQAPPVTGPGASIWWGTNNAPSGKQGFFFTSPPGYEEIDSAGKIALAGTMKIASGQTTGTLTFPTFPSKSSAGFPTEISNVQVTPSTAPIIVAAYASLTALTVTASAPVPQDIYLYYKVEGR